LRRSLRYAIAQLVWVKSTGITDERTSLNRGADRALPGLGRRSNHAKHVRVVPRAAFFVCLSYVGDRRRGHYGTVVISIFFRTISVRVVSLFACFRFVFGRRDRNLHSLSCTISVM